MDAFAEAEGVRAPFVRAGTTLLDLFDANVCGADLPRGKPDPEIFLAAARAIGVAPERSLVVEDAPSGVQAAKAGGMAALGVARHGDQALLAAAGADRVVESLDEVRIEGLGEGRIDRLAAA
jgi:beta-phosphoglucomutase-like phosphatase (HAD superfamily)